MKSVDSLPTAPGWTCEMITVIGDRLGEDGQPKVEEVELWKRDAVELVQSLISNPLFKHEIAYQPEKVYRDKSGKIHVYDEMWTGEWWWETQVSNLDCC
jgi:hypothetical protein